MTLCGQGLCCRMQQLYAAKPSFCTGRVKQYGSGMAAGSVQEQLLAWGHGGRGKGGGGGGGARAISRCLITNKH